MGELTTTLPQEAVKFLEELREQLRKFERCDDDEVTEMRLRVDQARAVEGHGMRVIGLDPGLAGSLAILDGPRASSDEEVILLTDLPVHRVGTANKKTLRAELDLHGLHGLLAEHGPYAHCFIEKVGPMPKQGVTSMFRFGVSFGAIQGIVAAMGIPMTLVQPKQWLSFHHCGPSPDAARQRGVQLYPSAAPRLARKLDANRADALLIAAYGLSAANHRAMAA